MVLLRSIPIQQTLFLRVKRWKKVLQANGTKKNQTGVAISIAHKIKSKPKLIQSYERIFYIY